jgi:hypothetical protein
MRSPTVELLLHTCDVHVSIFLTILHIVYVLQLLMCMHVHVAALALQVYLRVTETQGV